MTNPEAEARLSRAIDETALTLRDGIDIGDLATLIRNGVEIAETVDGLTGEEKLDMVQRYVGALIDMALDKSTQLAEWVAAIDIPWVPEGVEAAVVDPLIRMALPPVLKPLLLALVPGIVDTVLAASKGGLQVNTKLWLKAASVAELPQHAATILKALSIAEEIDPEGAGDLDLPTMKDLINAHSAVAALLN